jgi:hypothetical protein
MLKQKYKEKIESLYYSKRKNINGHYFTFTYNKENNKVIEKEKWHGTNEKGISPNFEAQSKNVVKFNTKLAKKNIDYKSWRNDGYSIPKSVQYTDKNMRFPFSYEVLVKYTSDDDSINERWITIQDDTPLVRNEITKKVRKLLLSDYHISKIKSISVKNLLLDKNNNYQQSYTKPSNKNIKNNRRNKNASKS